MSFMAVHYVGLCIPHCHLVRLFELNLAFFRTVFLKSHDAMSIKSAHLGVKMNCFKKPVFRNENRTLCNSLEFEPGISRGNGIGINCKKENRTAGQPASLPGEAPRGHGTERAKPIARRHTEGKTNSADTLWGT